MKLRDTLYVSVRAVRSELLQSLLELFAVAIGVALFSISLSLIQFYSRDIDEAAEDIRFRTVQVTAYPQEGFAGSDGAVAIASLERAQKLTFPLSLLEQIKAECPAVQYAFGSETWGYSTGSQDSSTYLSVQKVTSDFFGAHGLRLKEGSLLAESDYSAGKNVAVAGSEFARRMFPGGSAVGQKASLESFMSWEIVGVLQPHEERFARKGTGKDIDNQLIVPLDMSGTTSGMAFVARRSSLLDEAVSQVQVFFDATMGKSVVRVSSEREWLEKEKRMGVPLFTAISFISGAVLLVIAVNVLSLLSGRVAKRNRSIGLALAVGASRRELFAQHLTEFCLTGLTGGALGITLAAGTTSAIQGLINPEGISLPGIRLSLQPGTVAASVALVLGLNLLFGIVPALQAAGVRPADSMRME